MKLEQLVHCDHLPFWSHGKENQGLHKPPWQLIIRFFWSKIDVISIKSKSRFLFCTINMVRSFFFYVLTRSSCSLFFLFLEGRADKLSRRYNDSPNLSWNVQWTIATGLKRQLVTSAPSKVQWRHISSLLGGATQSTKTQGSINLDIPTQRLVPLDHRPLLRVLHLLIEYCSMASCMSTTGWCMMVFLFSGEMRLFKDVRPSRILSSE